MINQKFNNAPVLIYIAGSLFPHLHLMIHVMYQNSFKDHDKAFLVMLPITKTSGGSIVPGSKKPSIQATSKHEKIWRPKRAFCPIIKSSYYGCLCVTLFSEMLL